MNFKKLILKHFPFPVVGLNSGAFGGLIRGGNDFTGLDQRHTAQKESKKASRILIAADGADHAPILKDVTHAYRTFTRAGYDVEFVSAEGQPVQFRSSDLTDPVNRWFVEDAAAQYKVNHTLQVENNLPGRYAAIYFAGDDQAVTENQWFQQLAEMILDSNGIVAGLGDVQNVTDTFKLSTEVDAGYSLLNSDSAAPVSEYGSVAAKAVITDSAWLIHREKIEGIDYEYPAEIAERIVELLAKQVMR